MLRVASTVKPYSDPSQDLADYPCVKHHFKMLEHSGNSVQCSKTGMQWYPYELDFDPATQSIWFNKTYDTYTNDGLVTGGEWSPLLTSEYVLQMFVIQVKDMQLHTQQVLTDAQRTRIRCRAGVLDSTPGAKLDPSFNDHRFGCSARGTLHISLAGNGGSLGWQTGADVSVDPTLIDQRIGVVSKLYRGTSSAFQIPSDARFTHRGMDIYDSVGSPLSNSSAAVLTSYQTDPKTAADDPDFELVVGLPGDIYPPRQAAMTGGYFYGAAWFSFQDGYPADLDTAIKWMTASWLKGDRLIYPAWKGKV